MKRVERNTLKDGNYVAVHNRVGNITEIIFGRVDQSTGHSDFMWAILSKLKHEGEPFKHVKNDRHIQYPLGSSIYLLNDDEVQRHIVMESL